MSTPRQRRRSNATAAMPIRAISPAASAAGDAAGAAAGETARHSPARPGTVHETPGPSQSVSQQMPVTQKPVAHSDGSPQRPPCGTGVLLGVSVTGGVMVGVDDGVGVGAEGAQAGNVSEAM